MQKIDHTKNIIEIENISFSYGENEILKNITFNIHEGDYIGLVGPNGSGKTTLLRIILGLLKPASGNVRLFGKDMENFKDWPVIGYVPQKATNFDSNFPATVMEVVMMGRYGKRGLFHGIDHKDTKEAENALKSLEMWDYRDRLIGDLSGGQQQRVFIARALAGNPKIIFLDEPTVGIDEKTRKEFYAILKKLNKEFNLSLVLVSHDIETLIGEVMHVICVDRTLVCHSSPEEFLKESMIKQIGENKLNIMTHHHH